MVIDVVDTGGDRAGDQRVGDRQIRGFVKNFNRVKFLPI
jgi:hypothetical protein